ncbi:MAG: hypothetical protein H0V70_19155 [Ktedonobacteraceae bacterium]|nr:hypothetical protein [Ktedonobacteraceae bacterium]
MSNTEHMYVPPRTSIEETLVRIWGQVLGREHVGIKDHFQDLGGTSLHATRIFMRLRDDLGVSLSRSLILQFPTITQMATYIEAYQRDACVHTLAAITNTQGISKENNSSFPKDRK